MTNPFQQVIYEEELSEGRPSQRHPLEGHDYHRKSDTQLHYIVKDAGEAAKSLKGTRSEGKYLDQVNDASTVLHFRKSGMPDWYKKKYGHMKEEVELEEQDSKHYEIYDTKTSKTVHSFKANHMSHANIKADDWLESNGKTGKGLKVRPVNQGVKEEVESVAEGKDDKIAQLKKDYETAVHWSKNDTSPQKREAARQKAEKIKRHLETQYKQGVSEGSEYTEPKLGTIKANLMRTTKPTVQIQVFKHNTLRGDSYWVTKEVRTFKTMDQAQAYVDRINKYVMEDVELDEASDTKRPPNFTMYPIDRQDYKILKDPKKKPLPKDSKEWGRDGGEKKMKEEVELDEAAFAPTMKKAIAAHERGDHKMAKYHLDNAKTARYAMKSTDIPKHKELLDKYKELRDMHEEVELEEEQDSKHYEIYDTKTSKAVHSFKANHMSHANIKADDWLESNGKTGKGLKVRPVNQGVKEEVELDESLKTHYQNGYDAQKNGKTRQDNPHREGTPAASMWAKGWEHSSDKRVPQKFANEEVELEEAGAFSYGAKAPRKGSVAYYAELKRKQQEKNKKPIEPKDQMVGNARVTKEEVDLDEAVSVEHDRYMRSHGKKASGTGTWMFTHKRGGDVDYKNDKEVHQARGSFSDAAKSAKAWAKSHGHSSVYVMEEVELDEKTLTPAELKKREEVAKAMEREKPGMPMAKKMAIATAVAKRVAEQNEDTE